MSWEVIAALAYLACGLSCAAGAVEMHMRMLPGKSPWGYAIAMGGLWPLWIALFLIGKARRVR